MRDLNLPLQLFREEEKKGGLKEDLNISLSSTLHLRGQSQSFVHFLYSFTSQKITRCIERYSEEKCVRSNVVHIKIGYEIQFFIGICAIIEALASILNFFKGKGKNETI